MISEEINRIKTAKADIKTAIENKGVEVSSSAKIDDYASLIDDISSGGSSSKYGTMIDNYNGQTTTSFHLEALFKTLIIPSNIESIWQPFPSYSQLESIDFEANSQCTGLPDRCFLNITTLTTAILPSLITTIPIQCFDNTRIKTIDIPSGVTKFGDYCFRNNPSLTTVNVLGNSLTNIGAYAFENCTNLVGFNIPSTVVTIGNSAFKNTTSLSVNMIIPNGVNTIPQSCFASSGIIGVTIPNTVTTINMQAFENTKITSLIIPDSVITINSYSCWQNTQLSTVEIGTGCTSIGSCAFRNCQSLTSITIKATTPPTLGNIYDVFQNTNDCPIYVPSGSVESYKTESTWVQFANRIQAIPN